jgi:hypothetical protein
MPDGRVFVISGTTGGTKIGGGGEPTYSYEIIKDETSLPELHPSQVLRDSIDTNYYPGVQVVPHTGFLWIMNGRGWAIVDPNTHVEVERQVEFDVEYKGYTAGSSVVMLPLDPTKNYEAEVVVVGGHTPIDQLGLTKIHHLTLTQNGPKPWRVIADQMPYGRISANVVVQPNGKLLILNGAQQGVLGGGLFTFTSKGSALDAFLYDPDAPVGNKTKLLAKSQYQRLYHSVALLLPDGRTLVAGTGTF